VGRWTALVLVGVAALAAVSLGDAIRGNGEEEAGRPERRAPQDRPTTTSGLLAVAERLESRGIGGLLYAAIRRGLGCRVEVIALPTLSRSVLTSVDSCRIRVSPTGRVASGGPCGDPDERISSQTQVGVRMLRGCAPAWRPNGRLTFVRSRGGVVELVEPCASIRPCLRVVVPQREVSRPILELAWIDQRRLAALVRYPRQTSSLAVFEDGRLTVTDDSAYRLRSYLQPVGARLLVPALESPSVLGFDAGGLSGPFEALPRNLADGRAFVASPEGTWVASTAGERVFIYRAADGGPLDPIELDLEAEDLGWS
jgi:hypothetical protein